MTLAGGQMLRCWELSRRQLPDARSRRTSIAGGKHGTQFGP